MRRHVHAGQSMPFVAILLAFLTPFVFGVIEIAERQFQVALMEDSLRNAVRVGVQAMEYRAFAANRQRLTGEAASAMGRNALIANLRATRGLDVPPEQAAAATVWTALPEGGTCRFANGEVITFDRPALCAEMTVPLTGVGVMWGVFRPTIRAAATLDRLN